MPGPKPRIFPPKICIICGTTFHKIPTCGIKFWEKRLACFNGTCGKEVLKRFNNGFKKGHPCFTKEGQGWFTKGHVLANKGLHLKSNDALKRYRESGGRPYYYGKHLPESVKEKIRLARAKQQFPSGEKHWNWTGGHSPLRTKIQETNINRTWRSEVFKRDDYTCQDCGVRGGRLNVHHIKSFSDIILEHGITTIEEAKKCSELWDVANGLTLCVLCHRKTDSYGGRSRKKSRKNQLI